MTLECTQRDQPLLDEVMLESKRSFDLLRELVDHGALESDHRGHSERLGPRRELRHPREARWIDRTATRDHQLGDPPAVENGQRPRGLAHDPWGNQELPPVLPVALVEA